MTRGTRGDVQPFVALARGLCSERGWLVTICTEARWKGWVEAQCADITAGAVHFVCSGGDTQRQTETWVSKEARARRMHAYTCWHACTCCAAYTRLYLALLGTSAPRRTLHSPSVSHPHLAPLYPAPLDLPRQIMSSKTEALQELMLAASESNFFASAPVFMHHLTRLQQAAALIWCHALLAVTRCPPGCNTT